MKKYNTMNKTIIITLISFMLFGCTQNKLDLQKDTYLSFKEELLDNNNFTNEEELNFDLNISIDRINDEEISYKAIIDNPKENMYNIKALVIHDHFTEEIFPSIGIFDDSIDLLNDNEEVKEITLVGYIKTTKDIENLNIKVYVEYTNESDELVKIYYKTTK